MEEGLGDGNGLQIGKTHQMELHSPNLLSYAFDRT